jgi:hypothetical protein
LLAGIFLSVISIDLLLLVSLSNLPSLGEGQGVGFLTSCRSFGCTCR